MKITLIQTSLFWHDRDKNLEHFQRKIDGIGEKTDLIVLPEMFSTGFTMSPETQAEEVNGRSLDFLKNCAIKTGAAITGSVSVNDKGTHYNRLYWVGKDGSVQTYDKRHLFRMGGEDKHYEGGKKKLIVDLEGFRICPLVCYDLRFPVWSRNRFDKKTNDWDYDLLIYVANWPEARSFAWRQLLIARAIENQSYVVGVNRIGKDGNGYDHTGESVIIGPRGEEILNAGSHLEKVVTASIDKNQLDQFRKNFPAGLDADDFELKV
jgi:predicted amidohydrolase